MAETCKAIVLRTQAGVNELEVEKFGTDIECEAYLFKVLKPDAFTKNLTELESNEGYLYSVEKFNAGQWTTYKYLIMYVHEGSLMA